MVIMWIILLFCLTSILKSFKYLTYYSFFVWMHLPLSKIMYQAKILLAKVGKNVGWRWKCLSLYKRSFGKAWNIGGIILCSTFFSFMNYSSDISFYLFLGMERGIFLLLKKCVSSSEKEIIEKNVLFLTKLREEQP